MTTATLIPPTISTVKAGEFSLPGKILADTVALVAKASGKGNALTSMIVLTFKDQRVTIAATDLDVAASVKLPVKGKRAATVAVNAADLVSVTKALSNEDAVEIVTGQENVIIRSGDTVFELPSILDFPKMATTPPEPEAPAALDLVAFARAVRIAGSAASADEARPVLTGIFFHDVDGSPTAVATDSYRLAIAHDAPVGLNCLFPAAAARLAVALFDEDEDVSFDIVQNGRMIVLTSGAKVMQARLLEGEFPAYRNLLRPSSKDEFQVTVARGQLIEALNNCRVVSKGTASPVRVAVDEANMHLSVRAEQRHADEDIELTSGHANVPTVGMNPDYLVQLLKAVGTSDNIQLGYIDGLKPINLTDGTGDTSWAMLLMPVRMP